MHVVNCDSSTLKFQLIDAGCSVDTSHVWASSGCQNAPVISGNCSKPQDEVMLEQSWHYACSRCPKEPIVAEVARFLGLAQENLLSSEG